MKRIGIFVLLAALALSLPSPAMAASEPEDYLSATSEGTVPAATTTLTPEEEAIATPAGETVPTATVEVMEKENERATATPAASAPLGAMFSTVATMVVEAGKAQAASTPEAAITAELPEIETVAEGTVETTPESSPTPVATPTATAIPDATEEVLETTVTPAPTATATATPMVSECVAGGDFEVTGNQDQPTWQQRSSGDFQLIRPGIGYERSRGAFLGGYSRAQDAVWQVVQVPEGASEVQLSFRLYMGSSNYSRYLPDVLRVYLLDRQEGVTHTLLTYDSTMAAHEWVSVDLPALYDLGGHELELVFECEIEALYSTYFKIDDVALRAVLP